jgi:hypothetical protein
VWSAPLKPTPPRARRTPPRATASAAVLWLPALAAAVPPRPAQQDVGAVVMGDSGAPAPSSGGAEGELDELLEGAVYQQQRRRRVGKQGYGWLDKPGGTVIDLDTGTPYKENVVQLLGGRARNIAAAAKSLAEAAAPLNAHFGVYFGFYMPDGTGSLMSTAGGVFGEPLVQEAMAKTVGIMRATSIALTEKQGLDKVRLTNNTCLTPPLARYTIAEQCIHVLA